MAVQPNIVRAGGSMKSIARRLFLVVVLSLFVSCWDGGSGTETFDESNRPGIEYYPGDAEGDGKNYFLVKPWNYELTTNASRKYPLLVYMHGSSQAMYLKNLYYMGMGYCTWSDEANNMTEEYQKTIADSFRKTYPCFMYVPQGKGVEGDGGWDYPAIITQIEEFKTLYRIDENRIYVHGFSMGGWGSLTLAKNYYNYNGQLFAGIIMLSGGGSLSSAYDDIVKKTAFYMVAGYDRASDISSAQSVYDYLKNHAQNAGAVETYNGDYQLTSLKTVYTGDKWVLSKNGWNFAMLAKFDGVDHFTTCFPFGDPDVFAWLFSQNLANR